MEVDGAGSMKKRKMLDEQVSRSRLLEIHKYNLQNASGCGRGYTTRFIELLIPFS